MLLNGQHVVILRKHGSLIFSLYFTFQVGNEERIHVYYAHGLDNPTFVRRCYWLLDKTLENIVLVHYRETKEVGVKILKNENFEILSPKIITTPVNSNSCLTTDQSTPLHVMEDFDSGAANAYYEDLSDSIKANHEMTLHEINTLEWDELLVTNDSNDLAVSSGGNRLVYSCSTPSLITELLTYFNVMADMSTCFDQWNQKTVNGLSNDVRKPVHSFQVPIGGPISAYNSSPDISLLDNLVDPVAQSNNIYLNTPGGVCYQTPGTEVNSIVQREDSSAIGMGKSLDLLINNGLESQDSFGKWINCTVTASPCSMGDPVPESSSSSGQDSFTSPGEIFSITEVSPAWAYSTEKTK
ncbi:hypothetical protein Golob_004556, partial [Gossypium lobatum]|nr:hypothetical protein [Gossypium lobatum]